MPDHTQGPSSYCFDGFEVEASTGELRRNGAVIRLQPQPLQLLLTLLRQPGRLVTREELRQSLWPQETFGEFDDGLHHAVAKLREALGDSAQSPRYIETVPRRGYRFIARLEAAGPSAGRSFSVPRLGRIWLAVAALLLVAGVAVVFQFRRARAFSEKDSILLADFQNLTGDPVFDVTLKQALAIQLEQSPYLNIFPERRVRQALVYMGRSPEERVSGAVAREVCERSGVKAMLAGSIAGLGRGYVLSLEAVNCVTGDSLAREQVEADSKEKVLDALGKTSSRLRRKLGESLRSIQKFDVPLEQATTSSLEALKAYSQGWAQINKESQTEAIPYFERAVALDPSFASAYSALSLVYGNRLRHEEAIEYATKAFELRERVSERERFDIETRYGTNASGELSKTIETYQRWMATYPRDPTPHTRVGFRYLNAAEFEKAIAAGHESIRRDPLNAGGYWAPILGYLALNRAAAARALADDAIKNRHDSALTHDLLYEVAFVQGDTAAMRQQAEWARGRPDEHRLIAAQADSAAFFGRLKEARNIRRRAVELAERNDAKESEAYYLAAQAMIEASFGNDRQARGLVRNALAISRGRSVLIVAALSLARSGDRAQAEPLAEELCQRSPKYTLLNSVWLPAIRAEIEISRGEPARAVEHLQAAFPLEFGIALAHPRSCVAVDARGRALLGARDGAAAAREFQKIIDHRGLVPNHPAYALAHLGLARASALAGDAPKSRKAYQDFLDLWKDADPDIPVLRQAQAEYARLP